MTEREWQACADPTLMLTELTGRVSERKLRLFAVACCRHIWHLLPDQRSRSAVEVAERYADGLAGKRELAAAKGAALGATGRSAVNGAWAAYWAVSNNVSGTISYTCGAAVEAKARFAVHSSPGTGAEQGAAWDAALAIGTRDQASFLREVLGNPFRPVAADSAWLDWRSGLLRAMAWQIYESSDFRDLPVLADALEDAGCTDPTLLAHCRESGLHVRGCWVLDLLRSID